MLACWLAACACIGLLACCFVPCCVLVVCVIVYRFVRFSLTYSIFFVCIYVVFFGAVLMFFWCLACLPQGTEGEGLRGNPKTPRGNPSQRRVQYCVRVRICVIYSHYASESTSGDGATNSVALTRDCCW